MFRGRRLRRYIAMRFLTAIVGTFVVCMALIFMIDLIELLRQARRAQQLSTWSLAWMTLLRLPSFSEILMPFATLVGSIAALLSLGRRSELAVMRAGGMSAWQFLRPGLTVSFVLGVLAVTLYNPLAATARAEAERLQAEAFGKDASLLQSFGSGSWLRQDGADGPSVMNARAVANQGLTLIGVTAFQYSTSGQFSERIDAEKASLGDGVWHLDKSWVSRAGREPEFHAAWTISTGLTRERAKDALGSEIAVSFWDLPGFIEVAEKAKLSASRFRIQYQLLLSRPFLMVVMVLLAATVSLRSFRSGGVQKMVVTGMLGGILFFLLTEVSRQIGMAGLAPPQLAIWVPLIFAGLVATTIIFHQEDG
jgi:lipopolysaccharide export system permease protein